MPLSHALSAQRLGREAAIFLAGGVFTFLVGFPLQIFVARHLGASDLGVFGLYEAAMMLSADLLSLGIATSLVRFIPQYMEQKRYDDVRTLVRWALLAITALGLMGSGAAFFVGAKHWDLLGTDATYRPAYFIAITIIPLTMIVFAQGQALRGFLDIRYIVIGQSVLQLSIKALLTILLLTAGFGITGFVAAVVGAYLFAALWLGAGLYRRLAALPLGNAPGHPSNWRDLRLFVAHNYAVILAGAFAARLDRFLLGYFATASAVGVAIAVTSITSIPSIFQRVLLAVATPMFTQMFAKNDRDGLIYLFQVTTDWSMRATLPLAIFLLCFSRPLLNLYGPDFAELGATPLVMIVCGMLLNTAAGPVGSMLNATGGDRVVLIISILAAMLTILVLFIAVPSMALQGWALATAIVHAFQAAIAVYLLKKRYESQWWSPRYVKWLIPSAATGFFALALSLTLPAPGMAGLLVALVLCYTVFLAVSVVAGLNQEDLELVEAVRRAVSDRNRG